MRANSIGLVFISFVLLSPLGALMAALMQLLLHFPRLLLPRSHRLRLFLRSHHWPSLSYFHTIASKSFL